MDEKWRAAKAEADRGGTREREKKFWLTIRGGGAIRERVKSIGVMTRGKVEVKYFLSQEENLRLSEIEKEKCVEKRVKIGGGERARSRVRQASRWNKGGGRVECIYVVAPFEPHKRKKNFRPALSLKSRWKSLTTLNYGAEHYPRGRRGAREWILLRIKLLLNPKVGGGTDILCYSYLRTSLRNGSADICGHESRWLGNSNCRCNFHLRRSLTLNFA